MGWILLVTIPYHVALGGLLIWRLQMLAGRITEAERQKDERIDKTQAIGRNESGWRWRDRRTSVNSDDLRSTGATACPKGS